MKVVSPVHVKAIGPVHAKEVSKYHQACGRVGRVTNCGVRGLGFKSPGSILTSRSETTSLSRVVRDGWDPCSVPLSGRKKSPAVESSTWPLNSHNCSVNDTKTKTKTKSACGSSRQSACEKSSGPSACKGSSGPKCMRRSSGPNACEGSSGPGACERSSGPSSCESSSGPSQGLLQLQAWVYLGFYTRAADFYE